MWFIMFTWTRLTKWAKPGGTCRRRIMSHQICRECGIPLEASPMSLPHPFHSYDRKRLSRRCTNLKSLKKGIYIAVLKHSLGPPRQKHLFYLVVKWGTTLEGIISWQGAWPLSYASQHPWTGLVWGGGYASRSLCTKISKERCYLFALETLFTVWSVWMGVIRFLNGLQFLPTNSGKNQGTWQVLIWLEKKAGSWFCPCFKWLLALEPKEK